MWLLGGAVALLVPQELEGADPPAPRKVLIIGVDGTRPDALAVARTPNLDALKARGAFTDRAVTHPVTHSAACWSSMFTGVWGDKHGVNDPGNSFTGNQFARYPSFFRRLEAVNSNLNTVVFARWAPVTNATAGADVMQAFGSDAAITDATCQRLTNADPDVFFTILLDVDSAGHTYGFGPGSTNYVKAIEAADARIGQMIGALTNRATYALEDWLVVVLSDHGAHDGTLEQTRLTFQVISGRSAARGTLWPTPGIVDVCATVLAHMGVPIDPAWDLDARVEGLPLPLPRYGTNLVFNGDAEWNSGTNNYTPNRGVSWWVDTGPMTLGCYGSQAAFPGSASPGPVSRGRNFFLGGAGDDAVMTQIIDLAALAGDFADPGADYVLSGFLGGAGAEADCATFGARFLDATGNELGSASIGPVTAADRQETTGLLERRATGHLPAGTRLVEFALTAASGSTTNDATADDLSFMLASLPIAPPRILAWGFAGRAWQVEFDSATNRWYRLDRTEDFLSWTALPGLRVGDGTRAVLEDPDPPAGRAFYRLASGKP